MTKHTLADLALFGGPPAFPDTLHVGRPNIGDRARLMARLEEMLDRRWLTNHGPFVQEFEQRLADYLGVRHVIAMCNATIALEIAARALGLRGEVIVPSFTFVATAHALQWQEITPVFCDVAVGSHHIDPQQIARHITPRTTGIVGVHVWGIPCALEALQAVADQYGLQLMYDAAHAFGCSYQGQLLGRFGRLEVFSFHATKFFNAFEGGAIALDDDELAERIRLMHNFGFRGLDNVIYLGVNGKMSEASAAMGLTSLESLSTFVAVNRAHYHAYRAGLAAIPGLQLLTYDERESHNYQYVVVEIDEEAAGISRDRLVELLHAERVRARRYFYPACHKMEPYRSYFPHAGLLLPQTERLTQRVMTLPTGTAVTPDDVACICDVIRFATTHGPAIMQRAA